jgi:hypothetical protein
LTEHERQKKAFQKLISKDDAETEEHLEEMLESMEPRTCSQGTADWFVDQLLSGTPSTIDALILSTAPLVDPDGDEELFDAFAEVLSYAGHDPVEIIGSALPAESSSSSSSGEKDDDAAADDSNEEEDKDLLSSEDKAAKKQAENWVNTLIDPNVDMDAEFVDELESIDLEVLRWMVAIFKKNDYKEIAASACTKFLEKSILADTDKASRVFWPLSVQQLKDIAKEKSILRVTLMKKPELIEALLIPDDERASNAAQDASSKQKKGQQGKQLHSIPIQSLHLSLHYSSQRIFVRRKIAVNGTQPQLVTKMRSRF